MPGWHRSGVIDRATSTPRFNQRPSNVSWITETIEDFPARGAPFRTTIVPGAVDTRQ
jgi:hypothetical protein